MKVYQLTADRPEVDEGDNSLRINPIYGTAEGARTAALAWANDDREGLGMDTLDGLEWTCEETDANWEACGMRWEATDEGTDAIYVIVAVEVL